MRPGARALVVGAASPCRDAILTGLERRGYDTLACTPEDAILPDPDTEVDAAILAVPPPRGTTAAETDVATFIEALDAALVPAGLLARDLVARREAPQDCRLVVVCDWAITGPPGATAAAAVMGGLLGLARSWALEFAPLGATANAVVVGPDLITDGAPHPTPPGLVRRPTPEAVAHAVLFFLAPEASCITGQVLTVCGGRTPAALPV